ncbi:MAG TPA: MFS transporter [Chloroflexota bacterium]|nr:MFS transporter [Chloroflexota bacterium]
MHRANTRLSRTFGSLAIYNYRLFWFGQLISLSGTWMQTTAQAWLVLKLTNSPVALGTVTMLQFLPITMLTLFGGVLADRLPKRTVIIGTQSTAAAQALLLAFLVLSNQVHVWEIYALALVLGIVNAFDNPTRQAFVAEMVGPEQLQNAIALNSSLFNAARIIGPAMGGLVITTVGIGQAFLINGLSFFPVLAGLALMRPAEFFATPHLARGKMLRQLAEGLRYVRSTPDVLLTMIAVGVLGTFGYNFTTILPLIAKYVLHGGAGDLGLITSAMGVGSLAAALGVAGARQASLKVLLSAATFFSLMLILVGLSSWLPVTLILLLVLGVMSIIFSASANTRVQLSTPAHLRGRVMSLYFLLFAGTTPLGAGAVGLLAARLGVQAAIVLMGSMCVIGVGIAAGLAHGPATAD